MRQASILCDLRAEIARIEGVCVRHAVLPFGVEEIDQHVPGGGLSAGALHEFAGSCELADDAAATIFLAGILARSWGRSSGACAGPISSRPLFSLPASIPIVWCSWKRGATQTC